MAEDYSGLKRQIDNLTDECIDPRGALAPTAEQAAKIMRQGVTNPIHNYNIRTTMLNGIPSYEKIDTLYKTWAVPMSIHVGEALHERFVEDGKKELHRHISHAMWDFQQTHERPEALLFGPIRYREIPGGVLGVMSDHIEATIEVFERVTTYLNTLV